jgi:hypothetical protein
VCGADRWFLSRLRQGFASVSMHQGCSSDAASAQAACCIESAAIELVTRSLIGGDVMRVGLQPVLPRQGLLWFHLAARIQVGVLAWNTTSSMLELLIVV